jgi:quercetin dioxygenase-like cupin family protein
MSAPRRVVTTHNAEGDSVIWKDEPATNTKNIGLVSSTLLWATAESPAPFTGEEDAGDWILGSAPPANGSRFIHFELAPGTTTGTASPPQHRTDTVDYLVCTQGEMTLLNGEARVVLRPGDAVVVRGTMHGWVNDGDVPAVLFGVLLDGQPKREGSVAGATNAK